MLWECYAKGETVCHVHLMTKLFIDPEKPNEAKIRILSIDTNCALLHQLVCFFANMVVKRYEIVQD